jgi:hypothetical protein
MEKRRPLDAPSYARVSEEGLSGCFEDAALGAAKLTLNVFCRRMGAGAVDAAGLGLEDRWLLAGATRRRAGGRGCGAESFSEPNSSLSDGGEGGHESADMPSSALLGESDQARVSAGLPGKLFELPSNLTWRGSGSWFAEPGSTDSGEALAGKCRLRMRSSASSVERSTPCARASLGSTPRDMARSLNFKSSDMRRSRGGGGVRCYRVQCG